jgi:integrase
MPTADSQGDSQQPVQHSTGEIGAAEPDRAGRVPRAERLAQLGLRFTKGLPENIRDLVRTRPTGFRYVLSDGRSAQAVSGLYLRVGAKGEGVFWLQYRVRLGPAKGERRQLHIGAVTLEAARREARQALVRVEAGGDPLAERQEAEDERERAKASTLGAFFDDVYEPGVLKHLADGKSSAKRFRKVWGPLFSKPLDRIAPADIEAILAVRAAEGVKPGTLHRDFAALRAALRYAVRRKLLAALPFNVGEKPAPIAGPKKAPARRVRFLSEEERPRFMAALDADRDLFVQVVGRLALSTGMRRGEILGLSDSEINGEQIRIPGARTKTGKDHAVELNATAKEALARWKLRSLRGELFPVDRFGGSTLSRERKLERAWARVCRKAKVADFHFHDARHDFASRLLRSGASLAMVRDALGHSTIAMTERYAHLERRDLRAAVQAVTL